MLTSASAYDPKSTQEAWENNFAGFVDKNVTQIMLDYNDRSVIIVHDYNDGSSNGADGVEYEGRSAIQAMYESLFGTMNGTLDLSSIASPDIEEDGMVFHAWEAPAIGMDQIVQTFIFMDDKVTIQYQTVYINNAVLSSQNNNSRHRQIQSAPKNSLEVWENHGVAFFSQDLELIKLNYNDQSQLRLFNFANQETQLFTGPAEIAEFFIQFWSDLYDRTPTPCLEALIRQYTDLTFMVWDNTCTGFAWGVDTFAYVDNKIRFQNVAYHYVPIAPTEDDDVDSYTSDASARGMAFAGEAMGSLLLIVLQTFL